MNIRNLAFSFILLLCAAIVVVSCQGEHKKQENELPMSTKIKQKQYLVKGMVLYTNNCSNCHQKDGSGLKKLYPPLAQADFLKENPSKVICIIKFGMAGPVTVNGQVYNMEMPAHEKLTDLEIAELMTYIYAAFAKEDSLFEIKDVKAALEKCQ